MKRPKHVNVIVTKSEKDWLELKKNTIGGSEICAILGMNQWTSPFDIWRIKTGRAEYQESNMVMKRGKHFESGLVSLWEEVEGHKVIKASSKNVLYIDKQYPFLSVTPDRRFKHKDGGIRTLEAKTTFSRHDEPLDSWVYQLQWELMFTGDKFGELVWEYSDPRICYKSMTFESNPEMQELMKDYAIDWWETYVVGDIEPPLVNSNDVLTKFPKETEGKILEANEDIAGIYTKVKRLQDEIKVKDAKLETNKEQMKLFMQDAEKLTYFDEPLCTWKINKNGSRIFRIC